MGRGRLSEMESEMEIKRNDLENMIDWAGMAREIVLNQRCGDSFEQLSEVFTLLERIIGRGMAAIDKEDRRAPPRTWTQPERTRGPLKAW